MPPLETLARGRSPHCHANGGFDGSCQIPERPGALGLVHLSDPFRCRLVQRLRNVYLPCDLEDRHGYVNCGSHGLSGACSSDLQRRKRPTALELAPPSLLSALGPASPADPLVAGGARKSGAASETREPTEKVGEEAATAGAVRMTLSAACAERWYAVGWRRAGGRSDQEVSGGTGGGARGEGGTAPTAHSTPAVPPL